MTMVNRAHCLSSSPDLSAEECDNLKGILLKVKYPGNLINFATTRFIESRNQLQVGDVQTSAPVRIKLIAGRASFNVVKKDVAVGMSFTVA